MPTIIVRNNNLESALRIWKKKVEEEGTLKEYRRRQEYIKPSVRRKQKSLAAQRTARKLEKKRFRGDER